MLVETNQLINTLIFYKNILSSNIVRIIKENQYIRYKIRISKYLSRRVRRQQRIPYNL